MSKITGQFVTRFLAAALGLAVAQFPAASAQAADYEVGKIHIAEPWARATPKGASTGAGYMTITNNGVDRKSVV